MPERCGDINEEDLYTGRILHRLPALRGLLPGKAFKKQEDSKSFQKGIEKHSFKSARRRDRA